MDPGRRLDILKLDCRTKLNPKKKVKDSQNNKLKNRKVLGVDGGFTDASNPSSSTVPKACESKSLEVKSSTKNNNGKRTVDTKDEVHQRLSDSMDSSTQKNSIFLDQEKVEQKKNEELPSKMWWVPPLKPSSYVPPSFTVSEKSYSKVSSLSRPRIMRSAEDLRKEVISQCHQLEADRRIKVGRSAKNFSQRLDGGKECSSTSQMSGKPPLSLPTTQISGILSLSLPTTQISEISSPSLPTTQISGISSLSLPTSQISDISSPSLSSTSPTHSIATVISGQGCIEKCSSATFYDLSNSATEAASDINLPSSVQFVKEDKLNDSILPRNEEARKESTHPMQSDIYFTVGDVARKHIVYPVTSKLIRLCGKQGELFVDVINQLEKSCEEFEKACNKKCHEMEQRRD